VPDPPERLDTVRAQREVAMDTDRDGFTAAVS
jgi:hypothetical protein